jgi:hypothetical protein
MARLIIKKLNEVEGKEQYRVLTANRFAALQDFGAEVDNNSAWATIRQNMKISEKRVYLILN